MCLTWGAEDDYSQPADDKPQGVYRHQNKRMKQVALAWEYYPLQSTYFLFNGRWQDEVRRNWFRGVHVLRPLYGYFTSPRSTRCFRLLDRCLLQRLGVSRSWENVDTCTKYSAPLPLRVHICAIWAYHTRNATTYNLRQATGLRIPSSCDAVKRT